MAGVNMMLLQYARSWEIGLSLEHGTHTHTHGANWMNHLAGRLNVTIGKQKENAMKCVSLPADQFHYPRWLSNECVLRFNGFIDGNSSVGNVSKDK